MATPYDERFGVYIHVPFCTVRCGYCDFNTYAPGEVDGATPAGYVDAALREMERAARVDAHLRPADTVFFGGGTPTLLDPAALARLLQGVKDNWGLVDGAEVTTEANPDSIDEAGLEKLAEAGFTRVSVGMQSAVPHVLETLERTHTPSNVRRVVQGAKNAGLHISVDLIYGTPGESREDWRQSVEQAIELESDHVSAYALTIEPGTRMGNALRRGKIAPVDPDTQADMYENVDDLLTAAGFNWYEISNWSRDDASRCQHNMGYWYGSDWYGIGPGAHSYRRARGDQLARRWWNVKHPRAYSDRLNAGESPEADGEDLTPDQTELENIMLRLRLKEGLPVAEAGDLALHVQELKTRGLIEPEALASQRLALTRQGRLLVDGIIRDYV